MGVEMTKRPRAKQDSGEEDEDEEEHQQECGSVVPRAWTKTGEEHRRGPQRTGAVCEMSG